MDLPHRTSTFNTELSACPKIAIFTDRRSALHSTAAATDRRWVQAGPGEKGEVAEGRRGSLPAVLATCDSDLMVASKQKKKIP